MHAVLSVNETLLHTRVIGVITMYMVSNFKFPLYNEPIYIYRFEVQKGIFLKLYKTYKYI